MATLTNPITPQNIVERFADYVVATGNAGIVWGIGAKPFSEMPDSYFGGGTSGKSIEISGNSIAATPITALNIYNSLVQETNRYTRIRNLRARLSVTGGGGNTGTRPSAGVVFDQTRVANMSTSYLTSIGSPNNAGVTSGQIVTATNFENFFNNLRSAYNTARSSTVEVTISVCHASCHSSCHGSRSRR
jgi:hypothetical protein